VRRRGGSTCQYQDTPIRLLNRWWKGQLLLLRQLLSSAGELLANLEEKPKEDQAAEAAQICSQRGLNEVVRSGAIAGLSQLKTSVAALI